MSIAQKQTATQSQKLMIFVLSMSLYGLADRKSTRLNSSH